jgi:hypothetical protein
MLLNARGEDRTGSGAAFFGEGPEQQTAAYFAGGVLDRGQSEPLRLRPVARNIVEILGIRADLLKQCPGGFEGPRGLACADISSGAFLSSPCARQIRCMAMCETGRSNSRWSRAAPKVGDF